MNWINGLDHLYRDSVFLWLYGAAGAGKSAIAQTIAEMLDSRNGCIASFFFARDDPHRGTARFLVPTLAYQLAVKLPPVFRACVVQVFENDPLVVTRSFESQFTALIKGPLLQLLQNGCTFDHNIVIIIDGLDECEDSKVQARIVYAAFRVLQDESIPLKILLASRPEVAISSAFSLKGPEELTIVALDDDYQSREDIEYFLVDSFCKIKSQHCRRAHIPEGWPSPSQITTLVERSSGQFIYASTVVKYVESSRHRPTHRLEIVLGVRPTMAGDNPFAELDALYRHILMGVEEVDLILKILAFVTFCPPGFYDEVSVSFVEAFLSLETGDAQVLLHNLASLVSLDDWVGVRGPLGQISRAPWIRILHASLKDYLVDKSRSRDLYIDPPNMHAFFAQLSFSHISAGRKSGYYEAGIKI
ncbi:hypothetical protein JR316_0008492 [Psilocybe cubensis]|uniref:Uncharacterized protein n=2 Tax=Psilocybe cubensis TaxID=181762 RepID=A0ACB8GWE5_PSICU|nr:hypothetical protein JR316_0008492 [Psilocybe cubensis]KAH9479896.1 hypothetical protein JR316_0008492 [Psilocybe cubensis]